MFRLSRGTAKFSGQKLISLALTLLLAAPAILDASALARLNTLNADVRVTVTPSNLQETIPIRGAERKVTMVFRSIGLQDALRALARQGGFNVLVDDTVQGEISVDLNDVSIQAALDTLRDYGKLVYAVQGNNLIVTHADSEKAKSLQKTVTRVIPLKHGNAKVLANMLNQTLFFDQIMQQMNSASGGTAAAGASGQGGMTIPMPVTADFHTNSLIVVGTSTDIKIVEEHVTALDVPRDMKTWRLSQANALDVATILSSSLFNEGRPVLNTSASGGSSSGSSGAGGLGPSNAPSPLRVTAENLSEGSGSSQSSQTNGGGGGESAQLMDNITLRGRVKESQTIQVNPHGPLIVPDTRLNTITLLGTAEQIAMAEALIPTLDRKTPQVVMEVSLVEVKDQAMKELGHSMGMNRGNFSTGTNNVAQGSVTNQIFSNFIGRPTSGTSPLENIYRFSTDPTTKIRDFAYQLRGLVGQNKAKILANPTITVSSDNEAVVSMVDEIVRSVTVTQQMGVPPTATINLGEAGIVLNLLPRVGADNTVSLRVRPVVSTVVGSRRDRFDNLVTLLSRREVLAQNVVLRNGETFILGGLVHNTNASEVGRDPILSRLPIVGALARNTGSSRNKSELVVMITPHIINDESQVARHSNIPGTQLKPATLGHPATFSGSGEPGMVPVSLSGSQRSSALPPMEPVQVLGEQIGAPAGEAPWIIRPAEPVMNKTTSSSGAKPSPRPQAPISSLIPNTEPTAGSHNTGLNSSVISVVDEVFKANPTPAPPQGRQATQLSASPAGIGKPVVRSPQDISDDAIRAIMEKFK